MTAPETQLGRGRLFDAATRGRIRRQTDRGVCIVFMVVALLVGGLMAGLHHEMPVLPYWLSICPPDVPHYDCDYSPWLDVLAGAASAVIFGLFLTVLFRYRRIAPTVRCEGCGGRGWIIDLEASGGRCPLCGNERFAYFTIEAAGAPMFRVWRLKDTDGRDLLEMQAANKHLL